MRQYLSLLKNILDNGVRQPNRTGIDAISIPGAMMQFDLRQGFPAVTTKKLAFKSVVGELLGFFRGYTNAADFEKLGCNVWRQNADDPGVNNSNNWLTNPERRGPGDLGRIYGAQWTDWASYEYDQGATDLNAGYPAYMRTSINQLDAALVALLRDPTNRRVIVNAWRPDEFEQMALPPCHVLYQFLADAQNKRLHLAMYQRSCDALLGAPFNIASCALFLTIMARFIGYTPATFTHFIADAHIYVNHLDQVREQLSRTPFDQPRLAVDYAALPVLTLDTYKPGMFETIQPHHFELRCYEHHPAISAPMAV